MKIYSAALDGLHLTLTEIEADIARGMPIFIIVGLGDTSIKEARERIRSAVKHSGFNFPLNRKVINLSPADIKKQGTSFDLPIALSLLHASGQIINKKDQKIFCAGELALSGKVKKIPGVLPLIYFAKKKGFESVFIPYENRKEASLIKDINIYPIRSINELVIHLEGKKNILPYKNTDSENKNSIDLDVDFQDVYGHEIPKRVLEIAASGNHHICLVGPPGTGKTMLAKAFSGISPDLNEKDSMDVSMIYSITQNQHRKDLPIRTPQFRHIHHSTTSVTLLGGGAPLKMGEATLAHKGILFLDEFAEFKKSVLEELREPLQEGVIRLGRYGITRELPASFQLIAAMNPCPCGYLTDSHKTCQCTPYQCKQYYKKISGPILDRIDLIVEVPRLMQKHISTNIKPESSKIIKERVTKTRQVQEVRGITNNQIMMKDINDICRLDNQSKSFLKNVMDKLKLSPRSYLTVLKVSRTIADMEQSKSVIKNHIAEAVQYKKSFIY